MIYQHWIGGRRGKKWFFRINSLETHALLFYARGVHDNFCQDCSYCTVPYCAPTVDHGLLRLRQNRSFLTSYKHLRLSDKYCRQHVNFPWALRALLQYLGTLWIGVINKAFNLRPLASSRFSCCSLNAVNFGHFFSHSYSIKNHYNSFWYFFTERNKFRTNSETSEHYIYCTSRYGLAQEWSSKRVWTSPENPYSCQHILQLLAMIAIKIV